MTAIFRRAVLAMADCGRLHRPRRRRRSASATSPRSTGRCRSTSRPRKAGGRRSASTPNFSIFPAGAPQIAAAAAKSWDVGGTGLGAGRARRGALQHPDHRHHQRQVQGQRADGARRQVRRASRPTRKLLKGQRLLLTTNSTVDLRRPQLPEEVRAGRRPTCSSSISARPRSSPPSPPTTAMSPASGRPTPTRWRSAPTPNISAPAPTRARSCPARSSCAPTSPRSTRRRRELPRRLPARLGLGQGQPGRGAHADARLLQAGRPRSDAHAPWTRSSRCGRPSASTSSSSS